MNRKIDDFHLKHGRHDERTGKTIPVNTVPDKGDRVTREHRDKDMATLEDGALCKRMVEAVENNNVVTLFPTITAPYEAFEEGERNIGPPDALTCVCCGSEGGKGHGRRCTHKYRRCGFCRVGEVHRVLSTAHSKRGNPVPAPGALKVREVACDARTHALFVVIEQFVVTPSVSRLFQHISPKLQATVSLRTTTYHSLQLRHIDNYCAIVT